MIGLLIISHETLGAAYSALAKHFFPNHTFENIRILNVENHHDHIFIITRAQAILPELNSGAGVLILTDIFGATPCNAALKLLQNQNAAMITGLNAPMLIKALSYAHQYTELNVFVKKVKDAAIEGIMIFDSSNNEE